MRKFDAKARSVLMLAVSTVLALGVGPFSLDAQTGGRPSATEVLTAMSAYMGHWRSEDKVDAQDDVFHFELDLGWMDDGRTIAKLHIIRVASDGSTSTVFEGYKGREPDGSGVYYHAASPSGRGSRGEVVVEGQNLVTVYEGWTADGSRVWIRDVFEPPRGGSFDSRTFLRSGPNTDWRQIGADEWTRVGPSANRDR